MCALLMTWKIRNYFAYSNRHFKLCSPLFFAEHLENIKWQLSFYSNRVYIAREEMDDSSPSLKVEGKLIFVRQDGSEISDVFKTEFDENKKYKALRLQWSGKERLYDTIAIRCYLSLSSDLSPFMEYIAYTDFQVEKYSIVRFVFLPFAGDQEVQSDPIYLKVTSKKFSQFEILLKSTSEGIHIIIKLKEFEGGVNVKYKIKLLNEEDHLLCSFHGMKKLCCPCPSSELSVLVDKHDVNMDIWTENLKIIAAIEVSDCTSTTHIINTNYPLTNSYILSQNTRRNYGSSLNKNMKALYADKKLCDFPIRCHGREFLVHKVVRAAASPVFSAMFDMDMTEKQNCAVDIEDMEPDTVSKMIDFLYTDTLNEIDCDSCVDLYFAAHKYQMQNLKENCAFFIKEHLTVENVCDVLSISDIHQDEDLMKTAKDFVNFHTDQVLQSTEWERFMAINPKAACSTMYEIYKLNTSLY